MPKKPRKSVRKNVVPPRDREATESGAAETITIAWTVSVTSVFVADLIVIAAHLYSRSNPSAQAARVLEAIMLISAAAMGTISLGLLIVAWHSSVEAAARLHDLRSPRGRGANCCAGWAIVVVIKPNERTQSSTKSSAAQQLGSSVNGNAGPVANV
jgi:hypothetical protein